MSRFSGLAAALVVAGALFNTSAEAVQRSFVASFGSDANTATNCGFTNPCRGFTAAMSVTDSGGEVVALDAAGYGSVTITKSITLTSNPGFYAGISASTGNAITIATGSVKVTLRGLNINGIGAAHGVHMTAGDRLSIENCVISGFTGNGVYVSALATLRVLDSVVRENGEGIWLQNGATATITGTKVLGNSDSGVTVWATAGGFTTAAAIDDSVMSGNSGGGVVVGNTPAGSSGYASVTRSNISNNAYGVYVSHAGGSSVATIGGSFVTRNLATGLYNSSGATLRSQGNNLVDENSPNTGGTITTISGT